MPTESRVRGIQARTLILQRFANYAKVIYKDKIDYDHEYDGDKEKIRCMKMF